MAKVTRAEISLQGGMQRQAYCWGDYIACFTKEPSPQDLKEPAKSPNLENWGPYPLLWRNLIPVHMGTPYITTIYTERSEPTMNVNVSIPERGTKAFAQYGAQVMSYDGPIITRRRGSGDAWIDVDSPSWNWVDWDYAIKPQPKPKVWRWYTNEEALNLWDKYYVCLVRNIKTGVIKTAQLIPTTHPYLNTSQGLNVDEGTFLDGDKQPAYEWKAPGHDHWKKVGVCD